MPAMTGIELLERAKQRGARRQARAADGVRRHRRRDPAINDIGLDHYLLKPWDPPEERLYPVLDDLLGDWRRAPPRRSSAGPIVGHRWSERSHEVKTFLARNHVPYRVARPRARRRGAPAARPRARGADRPAPRARARRRDAARRRRLSSSPTRSGCAPAPSSRSTTSASSAAVRPGWPPRSTPRRRGCDVVLIEREAPGGQAGQSAAIENYLGFPKGLSGADLTHRAVAQVRRFGAEMVLARDVVGFEARGPVRAVRFGDGTEIEARARARRHRRVVPAARGTGLERAHRPRACTTARPPARRRVRGRRRVRRRRGELGRPGGAEPRPLRRDGSCCSCAASRSRQRCRSTSSSASATHRTSRCGCRPRSWPARGDDHLEGAHARRPRRRRPRRRSTTNWLFVFIGASPRTDWLGDDVARDEKGFVVTGQRPASRHGITAWPLDRIPVRARDERARGVRRRRRAARLDEAGGVGRRRRRDVRLPRAPLPGDDLMLADELRPLFLFDGLDRRAARRARRRRRRGRVRRRRGAVPRGRAGRLLVGAARRAGSSSCAGRDGPSPS